MTTITSAAPRRQTLWRLIGFLQPLHWAYFASLIGLAVVLATERTFMGYVVKLFIDAITGGGMGMLVNSVETWAVFLVVWIPVSVLLSYVWRSVTIRAVANLRQTIFSHLQRLPLGYHELRHSGDLVSVLTNDVTTAEQAFQQDMLNLFNATLQGISAAAFMLVLNWQLALLVFVCGLAPLIINALFVNSLRSASEVIQARVGGMSERMADLLAGYQVVRTYSLGDWILGRFGATNRDLLKSSLHKVRLDAMLTGMSGMGGILLLLVPLGVGSFMVLQGMTTFGTLVALIQLNNGLEYFVNTISGSISRIQTALAAADRIGAVLDASLEPDRYGEITSVPLPSTSGHVPLLEFRDVTFGYNGDQPVLNGMTFQVQQGQVVAFVGPSGGGKSTLFKLLLGCYPVRKGSGYVAGKDINGYRLSDLREQFAYIPQDAYLYSGSILDNILYGKPGATKDEAIGAAKAANAHGFISEFPEGYDTMVGERGARLSGGQRQRIAIARALLKDAPVLLLDEATSALDSESEELVQQALGVLMEGRTVMVIAHRLSTVEGADVIYALEDGKVVEAGTSAELLERKGLFYRLHELQFREQA
jgi:ATP-binding cassette subfamily B protein